MSTNTKKTIKTSQLLKNLSENLQSGEDFTFGKLIELLNHRSYGIGMLIFSLPSILPFSAIPGVSALFSIPILLFSIQLIFQRKNPWLPNWLKSKKLDIKTFKTFVEKSIPYIQRIEKFVKPRYLFFNSNAMQILLGVILTILSIFLMLPIPLSNMIFGSLIALIALGLVEDDGLVLLIGGVISLAAIAFYYKALGLLLSWIF